GALGSRARSPTWTARTLRPRSTSPRRCPSAALSADRCIADEAARAVLEARLETRLPLAVPLVGIARRVRGQEPRLRRGVLVDRPLRGDGRPARAVLADPEARLVAAALHGLHLPAIRRGADHHGVLVPEVPDLLVTGALLAGREQRRDVDERALRERVGRRLRQREGRIGRPQPARCERDHTDAER